MAERTDQMIFEWRNEFNDRSNRKAIGHSRVIRHLAAIFSASTSIRSNHCWRNQHGGCRRESAGRHCASPNRQRQSIRGQRWSILKCPWPQSDRLFSIPNAEIAKEFNPFHWKILKFYGLIGGRSRLDGPDFRERLVILCDVLQNRQQTRFINQSFVTPSHSLSLLSV